ncbi:PTH1 family peptidyl-tRNA hydrolase [Desulfobaculum xiamenense]|uniref:Peptidyl-tRNA hydrolase n=1 Tax=Desulfobaculum xiamenense TaxID=995050 RepID=A0A846QDX6_9BACT|nr:aminoacyl-tRNA hydrolase [Desulfobaculum xiamenense]NJB66578.1 PTH1 family peptidyl-tRNA hydrolase [Desulfobaculum xiamenense]
MKNYAGIIVGLGNPGPEYEHTRHNFGFMLADQLIEKAGGPQQCPKPVQWDDCIVHDCALIKSKPHWLVAKPLTYMNLSGVAVGRLSRKFGIAPADIIVAHDEMDLPLGKMKLKKGGGTAGHNGLNSIVEHLGTADFVRLRLGVGRPDGHGPTRDYVLGALDAEETGIANAVIDAAIKGIGILARRGMSFAVQHINSFDAVPSADAAENLD